MRIFSAGVAILATMAMVASGPARAQQPPATVRIGLIYPLTGGFAPTGQESKAVTELAADIINTPHDGFAALPLGDGKGLPHLGGAKLELVYADSQGSPSVGQSEALRLITQQHVIALDGASHSSVSQTASAVAERYGIPYLCGGSVAANLTQRGFKFFFRTTPIASDFAQNYVTFLGELKQAGRKVDSLAIVNENTDYGTSVGDSVQQYAEKAGLKIAARIPYSANATDVSPQVLQLKQAAPDAVVFVSYTADAILYAKTMKNLDYRPPVLIGDDSGFSDHGFLDNAADIAQGVLNRSAWKTGEPGSVTYHINELFRAKTGHDMDDTAGREMQGFFVLADAIDRAGSTDPEKIRAALAATDLKPAQLMMGFRGVKFDMTGQNVLAGTYLIQLFGKQYIAVWPKEQAERAFVYPYKGWQ